MTPHATTGTNSSSDTQDTLRLLWPQWQSARAATVATLLPELPRRGTPRLCPRGARPRGAVLPPHHVPTEIVPVEMGSSGPRERDGIEAEDVLLRQLTSAVQIREKHQPSRIVTLGRKLLTESAVRCHHEEVDDRGNQEA